MPQVEYLNWGIAFSSSLVALKTAWSGYHGFFADVDGLADPVVEDGLPPLLLVVAEGTGWSTNLTLSNGTATRCSPMPRKPPTPSTTALMFPLLSINRSLMVPMLSF